MYKNKRSLLHRVLQNSCLEIGARCNFWVPFGPSHVFLCKIHIFHIESEIYFKFYVLIYTEFENWALRKPVVIILFLGNL